MPVIEFAALRSRFAKRLLALFVGVALIPICTLALITYGSIGGELRAVSEERLEGLAKSTAMSILERLTLIEEQLSVLAAASTYQSADELRETLEEASRPRFRRLVWAPDGETAPIGRGPLAVPTLALDQRLHLAEGHMLLVTQGSGATARVLAAKRVPAAGGFDGTLWGEVEPRYLWWGIHGENHLPPLTELCAFQAKVDRTLFCSSDAVPQIPMAAREAMITTTSGGMDWERGGDRHRARYRTIFVDEPYGHSGFTVILSEALIRSTGPLREFRLSFVPIVLVTLWVVLLLSIRQIRRQLVPLERLRSGTREIARRNFESLVQVESDDEFAELTDSFNRMASRLGRQFRSLSVLSDVQSAVLSAHSESEVAGAVLAHGDQLLPFACTRLAVLNEQAPGFCTIYSLRGEDGAASSETGVRNEELLLAAEELRWLHHLSEVAVLAPTELPRFLRGLNGPSVESVVVVAISIDGRVAGVFAASLLPETVLESEEDLASIRQLGDQLALGLSKSNLIEKLQALNAGTLSALARTIDANSRWTLGHSERVKDLALELGKAVGLSAEDLGVLERGALLHDIGKVGVPASVLDKPTRLTADEMHQVRQHVVIGVKILKPVPSLADILPLVEQHHEWFDGSGYPYGISGDDIHPLARLLSVVDCYDALRSARPYREPVEELEVRRHLQNMAGRQFDPIMVDAFLGQLEARDREAFRPSVPRFGGGSASA